MGAKVSSFVEYWSKRVPGHACQASGFILVSTTTIAGRASPKHCSRRSPSMSIPMVCLRVNEQAGFVYLIGAAVQDITAFFC